jgi:hypothetical protein
MKNLFNIVLLLGSVTCLPALAEGIDSEEDIVEVPTLAAVDVKLENKAISEHPAVSGNWSKYYGFADDTTFMGESLEDEQTQKLAKSFDLYAKRYHESNSPLVHPNAKTIEYNDVRPKIAEAMERLAQDPQLFDQVVAELYGTMEKMVTNSTKDIIWAGRDRFVPHKLLMNPDEHLHFKNTYELLKRFATFKGLESNKLEKYDFRRLVAPDKILQHHPLPEVINIARMPEYMKIYQQIKQEVGAQNYADLSELSLKLQDAFTKEHKRESPRMRMHHIQVQRILTALISAQSLQE